MANKATIPIIDADEYTDVKIDRDEDGDVIKESITKYDEYNSINEVTTYYYNETGNMIMENVKLDYDGELEKIETIQYNQDGLPEIETRELFPGEETIERTYDDNGNEVETKTYYDGDLRYDTSREYDDQGNIVTETTSDYECNEKETIVYDQNVDMESTDRDVIYETDDVSPIDDITEDEIDEFPIILDDYDEHSFEFDSSATNDDDENIDDDDWDSDPVD